MDATLLCDVDCRGVRGLPEPGVLGTEDRIVANSANLRGSNLERQLRRSARKVNSSMVEVIFVLLLRQAAAPLRRLPFLRCWRSNVGAWEGTTGDGVDGEERSRQRRAR